MADEQTQTNAEEAGDQIVPAQSNTEGAGDQIVASPIHPALQNFVQQYGSTDSGSDFATEAAARVQQHLDIQKAADAANNVHEQFISNLDTTKQNLIYMAKNDPTSGPLALDLADITMRGLTNSLGGDPDNEHHNSLLDHMQSEIAHAAVQGWAGIDEGKARSALDQYSEHLSDGDRQSLDTYIDNMANLRGIDGQARQQEMVRQHIQGSNQVAAQWLTGLTDPQTGSMWYPDNWGQRMLADERLSPYDRAGLHSAYQNLLSNGDPKNSDSGIVTDLLQRSTLPPQDPNHPTVGEVIGNVGNRLSLQDAQYIANRLGPQDQSTTASTRSLVGAMQDAKGQIDNPAAYARFVSWLLPAAQSGNLILDEGSKDYSLSPERMQRFMPTGDDVIQPAQYAGSNRPSLGMIFAGGMNIHSDQIMGLAAQHTQATVDPVVDENGVPTFLQHRNDYVSKPTDQGVFGSELRPPRGNEDVVLPPGGDETNIGIDTGNEEWWNGRSGKIIRQTPGDIGPTMGSTYQNTPKDM